MATIISIEGNQISKTELGDVSNRFISVLNRAKKGELEALTPSKLRKTAGLENISEEEALSAIDTLKKLAAIFFEIACQNVSSCIDNQHVISLNQEKRAA